MGSVEKEDGGCGESSVERTDGGAGQALLAPAAVTNAVLDALWDQGITHVDMPATPQRVWEAAQSAKPAMAAE